MVVCKSQTVVLEPGGGTISRPATERVRLHPSVRVLLFGLANAALLGLFLLVAGPTPAEAAICPCSVPLDEVCPAACSFCLTRPVSCDCNTGCTSSGCPGGYQQLSSSTCFPNFFQSDYVCRRNATQLTSQCGGCVAGRYGTNCFECPGGASNPCNGHGACSDGIAGS